MVLPAVPLPGTGREASLGHRISRSPGTSTHKILSCGQKRTLAVVSGQGVHRGVAIRCDVCHRRYGRAPVLAMLAMVDGGGLGGWDVTVARRMSRRIGLVRAGDRAGVPRIPGVRLDLEPLTASWAQLECRTRNCTHKPRVARAKLVDLARAALAAGGSDAYV
jgi:hypothetical protein